MLNVDLLPRPWSCHRPKVAGYEPLIHANIERVSRSKRTGWRATVSVDDSPMTTSHHGTKAEAERHCERMLAAYTEAHYNAT